VKVKIIRAPLRVSLFGGGCDKPDYYTKYGATIVSFAINRYMYVIWNPRPTGGCRLSYSEVEEVSSLTTCKHTLVRAAAMRYGFEEPCTLSIISDVPRGTGLGSSSVLAVCLCKLCDILTVAEPMTLEQTSSPDVGLQDSLPAQFGGFKIYRLAKSYGFMTRTPVPQSAVDIINEYGMLLYTGITRDSAPILANWHDENTLHDIRRLAERMANTVNRWTPEYLGEALNVSWALKAGIDGVASDELRSQHAAMRGAGALGAKLLGAGGGGCWFVLVAPSKRQAVRDAVGLIEIPFQVAERGVEEWLL
jgi:D-glycero-alpha-D-manno-heptose-7-phosphate kinase